MVHAGELNVWELLIKDHRNVLTKIHLLEEALVDLLRQRTTDLTMGKALKLKEDFLELFKVGVTQHFIVEEEALFPTLRLGRGDEAKALVSELLAEHQIIMERYFKIKKVKGSAKDQDKLLLELLKGLSTHAQKEEEFIPPLMKQLNQEEMNRINETARRLGYNL